MKSPSADAEPDRSFHLAVWPGASAMAFVDRQKGARGTFCRPELRFRPA
jgi:hypothetical protein